MCSVIQHESTGKSLPQHTRFCLNETCHISPLRTILRQRLNEDNVLKYDSFSDVDSESHNPLTFVNMADTPDSVDSTK